jgi:streptogramin lyase
MFQEVIGSRRLWAVLVTLCGAPVMATLVVGGTAVARSARSQPAITEFKLAGPAAPWDITQGSDGNMWFVEDLQYSDSYRSKIGVVTPSGRITLYGSPHSGALSAEARGPGGNTWFLEAADETYLGKITPKGVITESK